MALCTLVHLDPRHQRSEEYIDQKYFDMCLRFLFLPLDTDINDADVNESWRSNRLEFKRRLQLHLRENPYKIVVLAHMIHFSLLTGIHMTSLFDEIDTDENMCDLAHIQGWIEEVLFRNGYETCKIHNNYDTFREFLTLTEVYHSNNIENTFDEKDDEICNERMVDDRQDDVSYDYVRCEKVIRIDFVKNNVFQQNLEDFNLDTTLDDICENFWQDYFFLNCNCY
jgi:hypothetical protein